MGHGMGSGKTDYLRVLIGEDFWDRVMTQVKKVQENLEAMKEMAKGTAFDE